MGNSTLGSVTLQGDGKAFIVELPGRKESVLTPLPFYLSDSDETDVFDFGGALRTFTLSGIYIGTSEAAVKSFVQSIEALIQGHQDVNAGYPLNFTDDRLGTVKVKLMDFEYVYVAGFPTACTWTLKLIESSQNA